MNHRMLSLLLLIGASSLTCTSNPFGGNEVSANKRTVKGEITLTDSDDKLDGVYIWLEGFDIGTQTNATGEFQITLPPASAQGAGTGADGVYKLYFYVANYALSFSELAVRDGEFLFSVGEINSEGELSNPKSLSKLMDIRTEVSPAFVTQNHSTPISATVILRSLEDSVTVAFPNSIGGLLGGLFLRNTSTGRVHIVEGPPNTEIATQVVTRQASSRSMLFDLIRNPLPPGSYEVIPYLLVHHEVIPPELLSRLGSNVTGLNANYLNLPFKRDSAMLVVTN